MRRTTKVYTAVFRPWYQPYEWFGRDSGLVTEGLRSIGIDSKLVILDTPGMPKDERFLPADRGQFCDPGFWNALEVDAVVLQGGGEAATQPVADAIKASRAKLIYRIDTDGIVDPSVDPWLFFYGKWWSMGNPLRLRYIKWEERAWAKEKASGIASGEKPVSMNTCYGNESLKLALQLAIRPALVPMLCLLKALFPNRYGRGRIARRLAKADAILAESRIATARLQRLLHCSGFPEKVMRVHTLPIPIPSGACPSPIGKRENIVITAGRLYDDQKDAELFVRTIAQFLEMRPDYRAVAIGDGCRYVRGLVHKCGKNVASRVDIHGRMSPNRIRELETKAKVFLCTSRGESMHIASAEAALAGCSIVGPCEIASMQDYASNSSGSLSLTRSVSSMVDALSAEANEWDCGNRCPESIAQFSTKRFSPENHAKQLVQLINEL